MRRRDFVLESSLFLVALVLLFTFERLREEGGMVWKGKGRTDVCSATTHSISLLQDNQGGLGWKRRRGWRERGGEHIQMEPYTYLL